MANAQFQLGPGLLSANNVLNNVQQVNERIQDCQEELRRMHRDFSSVQDLAQELGYPETLDESINKLEVLQEDRRHLERRCTRLRDGLKTRIDRLKELANAKPDEMSSFLESLDPKVQVFLVRLIPRVFNDRQSMLDISPQYKELILEDLRYLDRWQGPTLTQEQANSEKIKQLSAENSVLKDEKKTLKIERMDMKDSIQRLNNVCRITGANSDRWKRERDEYREEVRRLVQEKEGLNREKIQAQKDFLEERRHYKSLQATSEGLQDEKDRLSSELKESADSSRKKDSDIESLNNRIKELVGSSSGTSKSIKELQRECKALQAQKDKSREELRELEKKSASDREAARAIYTQKRDELQTQLGDLAQQLADANGRAQELQEQNDALRRAAEKSHDKKTEVSNQLKQLRNRYESKKDTITKLQEEKDAIQGDKDKAESKAASLQGRVGRMQARIDEMKEREQQLTRNEQQLTMRLEEGEVSTGAAVTKLKSRAMELENEVASLKFQHDNATQMLESAEDRESKLINSFDKLKVAHTGCGMAQTSLRDDIANAKGELSDIIVERDRLQGTAQDLRERLSKLEASLNSERHAADKVRDEKKELQREKEEALEGLQREQEEVHKLGEARDSLDAEISEQNDRITSLTEELTAAAQEQQRLQESLDQEKESHAGTAVRENALSRDLSECRQQAGETRRDLQQQLNETRKSLETAQQDGETDRAALSALQKTMSDLKLETKGEQDLLKREISTLKTDLSAEAASRDSTERSLKNNAEGVQQFLTRACGIPTDEPQVVSGLAMELQRSTYVAATGEGHIHWEILDSWTDELPQDGDEVAQVPPTLELLAFELFGAAHAGRVNSKTCQMAIHKMSELLLSAEMVHVGLMTQLGTALVREITSRADVSFEIGAACWQLLNIVEERWQSPHQAVWKGMKRALENVLKTHLCGEAFAVITAGAELHEGEPCHLYNDTYAVFCRPAWKDAILFNRSNKSVRFFTKTRFTLNCTDATIEPMGGHRVVTLPLDTDRDMEWALDWMGSSE